MDQPKVSPENNSKFNAPLTLYEIKTAVQSVNSRVRTRVRVRPSPDSYLVEFYTIFGMFNHVFEHGTLLATLDFPNS